MKKLILTISILSCVLLNSYAAEKIPVVKGETNSNVLSDQQNQTSDIQSLDLSSVEKAKKLKASKNKTFFGKIKEKISNITFCKRNIFRGNNFNILPFILGFLLGPIGILIVFLVNLKKPERKAKVLAAVSGWTLWLLIFSIILAAS